jgi:hypothetical protein
MFLATGLALSGCGNATTDAEESSASDGGTSASMASDRTEVGALTPRIVLAYDGGVITLDSADGTVLNDTPVEGYVRLNPAGDGRNVMVSSSDGFTAYDTGLIAQAHGDHFHYYEQAPALTSATIAGEEPGHVVVHGEHTATFADGTGEATIFDNTELAEGTFGETTTVAADAPHHGVAVPLEDGEVLRTEGTVDERHTVLVQDADGNEIARTDDCPGVHGEATAKDDVVSLGCENGSVIYRDGEFHKVAVEDDFQRSGNQKGHPDSTIVLADHKTDPDPEGGIEHPTEVALIDTTDDSQKLVDLGASYWFRSLDRGPDGEALVLTTDGQLNILDPESGEVLYEPQVVEPWEEDPQWQTAGPMLSVADGTAFVVDPEQKKLTMVDIAGGEVYRELPVIPHEIQVTTGYASGEVEVAPGSDTDHDTDDHDHDDHDHED